MGLTAGIWQHRGTQGCWYTALIMERHAHRGSELRNHSKPRVCIQISFFSFSKASLRYLALLLPLLSQGVATH